MAPHWNRSPLCRLIGDSLRPYIEAELDSITKNKEKDLLMVLSQVFRQIQLLKSELVCVSDNDSIQCSDVREPHSEGHHSLAKILADLAIFMTVENQFVQHSAGNILVLSSEIVSEFEGDWKCFIHLLCFCLELALSISLSHTLPLSTKTGTKKLNDDITSYVALLRPMLKNANWFTISNIIRVLRDSLKIMKQEDDDQLLTIYLNCVNSCLMIIPWNLLNEIHIYPNGDAWTSSCNFSFIMFLGNFVQFICSLVEQSGLVESAERFPSAHPILQNISNLLPDVLFWCIGNQGDHNNMLLSSYFRHKLLMLMKRLCSQIGQNHSLHLTWLKLLHKYFQGLLLQPLTEADSRNGDSLQGSPFLSSLSDGEIKSVSASHLQRHAIFLFLKCSFSLIGFQEETDKPRAFAVSNSCSAFDCCKNKGMLELYEWLQGHLPSDFFLRYNIHNQKCVNFARSFLKLFMHEDDILFEVLLQLCSCVPYGAKQQLIKERGSWKESKEDILHHVSNIFNPVCLFHLFLAELHYDHQVLIDYLISKDTGIRCAEYLLRCLRIVCESWPLFLEFSMDEVVINEFSCKKRKVIIDDTNSLAETSSTLCKVALSVCNGELAFQKVKACLLALKSSLENLHQNSLFPYNPEALIRRLRKFQELCLK